VCPGVLPAHLKTISKFYCAIDVKLYALSFSGVFLEPFLNNGDFCHLPVLFIKKSKDTSENSITGNSTAVITLERDYMEKGVLE